VSLLIDTHVLLWMRLEPHKLSARAASLLRDKEYRIFVSAITAWEIGTKVRIGKLSFPVDVLDNFDDSMRSMGFETLAILPTHAVTGARIESPHKDPFDRMLAGQAKAEGLKLVSADPAFRLLGIDAIW
jgi:PIN domain nuclease of toxin-antitoxin system